MKKILGVLVAGLVLVLGLARLIVPPIGEKAMNVVTPHDPWPVSAAAEQLHASLTVGDWHTDSLLWDRDLLARKDYGHVDFPRLREGNVAVQVFTAVTKSPKGQNYESNETEAGDNITTLAMIQTWPIATWSSLAERALYQMARLQELEERDPASVKIILGKADLEEVLNRRAAGEQVTGAMMGMEGAHPLEGNMANLDRLYDAGYRLIGLQHFFDNALGGSLHGTSGEGLTAFGRQVVQEAAARHMVIDVAHSAPAVVEDVLTLVDAPLVVSHTGIYSHCETPRNFQDSLMQKIAAAGGIIAIGYWADVTCDDTPAGIVKAIRAAIDLVGEDHVSLGSDYDGTVTTSFDTSELAALTHEMLEQGFTEAEIRKVMGDNMVRMLREVLR